MSKYQYLIQSDGEIYQPQSKRWFKVIDKKAEIPDECFLNSNQEANTIVRKYCKNRKCFIVTLENIVSKNN